MGRTTTPSSAPIRTTFTPPSVTPTTPTHTPCPAVKQCPRHEAPPAQPSDRRVTAAVRGGGGAVGAKPLGERPVDVGHPVLTGGSRGASPVAAVAQRTVQPELVPLRAAPAGQIPRRV